MSLVDTRSTKDHLIEHWHRLVDCKHDALVAKWAIQKKMEPNGRVTFGNLGIVRTLEKEKVKEVSDRIIIRMEEQGANIRSDKWQCTQIANRAEQQCKETSAYRLKLCFEAFLPNSQGGTVKVAEHVFSEDVFDLTSMNTGELAIKKMSICHDFVDGGAEVMIFTGGDGNVNKISYTKSAFHADFFQINPQDESRIWQHRVTILDNQIHGVGQHLGGVHFCVPPYDRQGNDRPTSIERETENVFMELIKTGKNNSTVQARSDPLSFTYKPSAMQLQRLMLKRRDPSNFETIIRKAPKTDTEYKFEPCFVPQDPPVYQMDPEQLNIPTVIHPPVLSFTSQQRNLSSQISQFQDPFSPTSALEDLSIQSPLSQHPSSPMNNILLSPNPHGHTNSPHITHVQSPAISPLLPQRSPGPFYQTLTPAQALPPHQYFNGPIQTIDIDDIGTIDISEIIQNDILGLGEPLDIGNYFQDGRQQGLVVMDGGGANKDKNEKELKTTAKKLKKITEKKVKNGQKEDIMTKLLKLKL